MEQMTLGDVLCFAIRAVQCRRANDHFIFGRVRSRLGKKSWETVAKVACAEAHCLGSVGLLNAAIRSPVILYGRISGSDHQQQDQESDYQQWSSGCAICGRCHPQSVGPPNSAILRQVVRERGLQSV